MIREVGFLLRRPNPEIQAYIETVDKTLDMVFGVPDGRRAELVSYLKGKHSKGYWDVTLHYLPLYSAAGLAEVKIDTQTLTNTKNCMRSEFEGKKQEDASQTGDD